MDNPFNFHDLHQPGHGATGNIKALASQLPPDLADAVDLPVGVENALDLGMKLLAPFGTIRLAQRVTSYGGPANLLDAANTMGSPLYTR